MSKELTSILLTLSVVAILFGIWFVGVQRGWYIRKSANDIELCRNATDTLSLRWKDPSYSITGWSAHNGNDDVLHIEVNLSKGYCPNPKISIDTTRIKYIKLYEQTYHISDIPACR